MATLKMPTPIRRDTSENFWIRKKVPLDLRPLVGKSEIWKTLKTSDRRQADIRIGRVNAEIEDEFARLRAGPRQAPARPALEPFKLTHQDLHAIRRETHERIRAHWSKEPPTGFARLRLASANDEDLEFSAVEVLEEGGYEPSVENIERLKPLLLRARRDAATDVEHARVGDYERMADLSKIPPRATPALDFIAAFEEYAEKGGLKGGVDGPTAKRWRPKIKAFCDFIGHRDLKRMTTGEGYRWVDHLLTRTKPDGGNYHHSSIKNVWIASIKATASFMVERTKIDTNPFMGIKFRKDKGEDNDMVKPSEQKSEIHPVPPRKGFKLEEAQRILTETLAIPSHLISVEMKAARRWLPWLCAYSGARVNEITSLRAGDITQEFEGIWCMVIKPSLEKTRQWRIVPIHSHVIEQGFLDYVDSRRGRLKDHLFYDPARGRGGKTGNPQFKKVAERICEWIRERKIVDGSVKPNHAWRHLFKSVARHVQMDREVEGFITGHRPKDSNAGHDYGDRWIRTMSDAIEKYPRFEIAALDEAPRPHKRRRRPPAKIAAADVASQT